MRVTVEGAEIIVTDRVTAWSASYLHSKAMNGLALTRVVTSHDAWSVEHERFIAATHPVACEWARNLRWMV